MRTNAEAFKIFFRDERQRRRVAVSMLCIGMMISIASFPQHQIVQKFVWDA
jgi:predicted transcriptional regulator YheO